jgi:aminoglycoside phosphotransferase (APT) family kinase protein
MLRRRGYRHVTLLPWDRDQVLRVGALAPPQRITAAERFPCRAVLVASRRPAGETAFERAVSEASRRLGCRVCPTWPSARASGLVSICDQGVLRVAIGQSGRQIDAHTQALAALAATSPPDVVALRVPAVLGQGQVGLARWSLETRLGGVPAPHSIDASLLAKCVEFLAALNRLGEAGVTRRALEQSELVRPVLRRDAAERLRELAVRVDDVLDGVPRGFGHGDFCTSNLLVEDGELTGVVDWEAASASSAPLLDLVHMYLLTARRPNVYQWGAAVIDYLWPLLRRGRDPVIRSYLDRLGLEPDAAQLDALVVAYWLGRTSYQLAMYLDRAQDETWMEQNVSRVLETFTA